MILGMFHQSTRELTAVLSVPVFVYAPCMCRSRGFCLQQRGTLRFEKPTSRKNHPCGGPPLARRACLKSAPLMGQEFSWIVFKTQAMARSLAAWGLW